MKTGEGLYAPAGYRVVCQSGHKAPPTLMQTVSRVGFFLGLLWAVGGVARAAESFAGSPFGPAVAAAFAATESGDPARGNRALMLSGGYDALVLRVHLIRQARTSIEVQTFIWTNDEVGRLLMYELIAAAKRGVKVRIIADQMVSDQDPATAAFLATAGPTTSTSRSRKFKPSEWS